MREAHYDIITREYRESIPLPFRKYIETYSFFQIAGNVAGLNILDLACGDGFYTRKLKLAGAYAVTGVDISQALIGLAESNEQKKPIGCSYMACDVALLPYLGSFDLVVAMYLLNYAKSKKELLAFCKAAYKQLCDGGRFIGYIDNIPNDISHYEIYWKHGFIRLCNLSRQEGDPVLYTFYNEDGSTIQFINYYLHPETYEETFKKAGFVDFQWIDPVPEASQQNGRYRDHFMTQPPIMGFCATKT